MTLEAQRQQSSACYWARFLEGGKGLFHVHRAEHFLFPVHCAQLKLFPVHRAQIKLYFLCTVQSVLLFPVHRAEQKLFLVHRTQTTLTHPHIRTVQ